MGGGGGGGGGLGNMKCNARSCNYINLIIKSRLFGQRVQHELHKNNVITEYVQTSIVSDAIEWFVNLLYGNGFTRDDVDQLLDVLCCD